MAGASYRQTLLRACYVAPIWLLAASVTYGAFALFDAVNYEPQTYLYLAAVWAVSAAVLLTLAKLVFISNRRWRPLFLILALLLGGIINLSAYTTLSEIKTARTGSSQNHSQSVSPLNLLPGYTRELIDMSERN